MPQNVNKGNKKQLPRIKSQPAQVESEEEVLDNDVDESVCAAVAPVQEKFSLYVRGGAWIKDKDNAINRLREIEPRIRDVRHPRQKSADYCFIDFASATDRDQSYESLKNHSDVNVKPVTTDKPKLLDKRIKKIVEKREAKKETRKLLAKIKKNQQSSEHATEKTNQLVIVNLPQQITVAELKQQYPKAVKVNLKQKNKLKKNSSAIIMFPNHHDAFSASKQSIVLHGQKLNVVLNTSASFKKQLKKRKAPSKQENGEPKLKSPKVAA